MATLKANGSIDMTLGFKLFDTVVAYGSKKYSTSNGSYTMECSGTFKYLGRGNYLNYSKSTITGIKVYDDSSSLLCEVKGLSIAGSKYQENLDKDEEYGAYYVMSYALRGNDTITGSSSNDTLDGCGGNDTINGGEGEDVIYGGNGNDTINGGKGIDIIWGDPGKDKLTGGAGGDTFCFTRADDSGVGSSKRDIITDFKGSREGDLIDLSQVYDADSGEQIEFVYIGSANFSGKKPQVRFANGVLQMNAGPDKIADWEIELKAVKSFSADFLILSSDDVL